MKLANRSVKYLSIPLLIIIGIWALVFYFNMLNEIKGSVDEGLENYKRQIIYRAGADTTILSKSNFDEGFFSIAEISGQEAFSFKDQYIDTMMYMQDADDQNPELEPIRMLITAFAMNNRYYELRIINSMVEEDDLIEELFVKAVWLYLILVVSIIVINNFVLQRLWHPFYSLLNQLKKYRVGSSKNFPEVKTRTKEFKDLQHAVNILLQHNIETYDQQKQFIGNASHELQTPLAIAIAKLELLIEKEDLEDSHAESIAEVMTIVERLIRLNKALLLLTKIENKQFLDNHTVSLNKIVRQNISDLEDIAGHKEVNISITESAEFSVEMDFSLANIVVSNLLRNAVFHNIPGGKITINISETGMKISNTGINKTLDTGKLFTRFHKSETTQSGTGLGLAIVKAISGLYGFSVTYNFENNLHNFEFHFS